MRCLFLAIAFALTLASAHAGWGWGGGPRVSVGFGYGWGRGYCGPGWGGWYGPPPVVVYQAPVYYAPVRRVYVVEPPVGQPTVMRVQAQLARLGYYRGEVDGDFGPMTAKALRHYQVDNDLPVTGRLDRFTLASLGG